MNKQMIKNSGVMLAVLAALCAAGAAQAQTLHVLRPVRNAIVRETVPVRVAPGDLPAEGYVGITIDGKFRTARVLPQNKHDPIYDWDTKASYATPDDPNTQRFVSDGTHTLTIKVYDAAGKNLGAETIPLRVANKISVPTQGIKLAYHWSNGLQQRYQRRTQLQTIGDGSTSADQTLQASLVRFSRTVEDVSGNSYLIRDRVLPGGVLSNHGQAQDLDAQGSIKSVYRTVDARGQVLSTMASLSAGLHFGFSIPVLSARRVSVGDTWQAPVQVSLEWASSEPATINAESRLEGFEWQDGYPTAKIRETYSGPVTFNAPGSGGAGGGPTGSSATAPTVNFERIVYFAYNSGRLVRTEQTMTLTTDNASVLLAGIGGAGGGPMGGPSAFNMTPEGQPPPPVPGPYPGGPGPAPGAYPGAAPVNAPSATTNIRATEIITQG